MRSVPVTIMNSRTLRDQHTDMAAAAAHVSTTSAVERREDDVGGSTPQRRVNWRRSVRRTRWWDLFLLGAVLAVLGSVIVFVRASGLRIQHTGSLPMGLYRDVPHARPARGAIGVWCLPIGTARWARARGYIGPGPCPGNIEPLGKVIMAREDDTVRLSGDGIMVNGAAVPNSRPVARDSRGRPLTPVPSGTYVLQHGQVWLGSPYTDRSFDSRYFGPVPDAMLVSVVRPVWTVPLAGSSESARR